MPGEYLLWNEQRGDWCNYDIVGESFYGANIQSLLPDGWTGDGVEVRRNFELIPEPDNPHDEWAISVRADGQTVGYLCREDAPHWANVVRRVVASGLVPVVPGRIYAYEATDWDAWDGENDPPKDLAARVQLKLGDPHGALPLNVPPSVPYTLIPRSAIVQVTKEDEHSDVLLRFVPAAGYGALFVTLHECSTGRPGSAKQVVEIRIDDERIGQLTPQMSQRFLPMIRHLDARGLVTACWGDIKGSAVAAEVRIDGIKANEADASVLDGDPVTLPALVGFQDDPLGYDLSPGVVGTTQPDRRHTYASERSVSATAAPPPLPPAAWYDDPSDPSMFRYWDGLRWTAHVAPKVR
ncbi:DUF2510 domain-containing protein [Mycolicibacterium diernhoferi]|uniref:DUF2510 domain-containing protein n=1 Tax=Mycolicibacterium diernhoferi TaxID=1801 RepID=A0A1Q4H7I0_9MYCO|nr:DUF2510 domain-containing protein [Mycolicibacterium diernhoferi]OJZ63509.1 hypothetical protein BRW64_22015 [Mycolicibacterium diernhoferi]OPE53774.1 hypothetical protein BV510_13795 [Mycolicibacterium diernhoferi]PEG51751.1 DUF2510 domain-containing protein [Mycolicibacterium diernhoferi]QYL24440.1 DUF2510 domain-containing protein [Mycolicibacterium diernhoferi]